jgi:hypothetical protein
LEDQHAIVPAADFGLDYAHRKDLLQLTNP